MTNKKRKYKNQTSKLNYLYIDKTNQRNEDMNKRSQKHSESVKLKSEQHDSLEKGDLKDFLH